MIKRAISKKMLGKLLDMIREILNSTDQKKFLSFNNF